MTSCAPDFPWEVEHIVTLTKLWGEGQSSTQIAATLGGGLSRSAVIGKLSRLGLMRTREATKASMSLNAVNKPKAAPRVKQPPKPVGNTVSAPPPPETDAPASATALTLTSHCCHWPIGDPGAPGFSFCGRRINSGVYCVEHAKRAYLPKPKSPPSKHRARDDRRYNGRRRFG